LVEGVGYDERVAVQFFEVAAFSVDEETQGFYQVLCFGRVFARYYGLQVGYRWVDGGGYCWGHNGLLNASFAFK
jgi:hypothetical protein